MDALTIDIIRSVFSDLMDTESSSYVASLDSLHPNDKIHFVLNPIRIKRIKWFYMIESGTIKWDALQLGIKQCKASQNPKAAYLWKEYRLYTITSIEKYDAEKEILEEPLPRRIDIRSINRPSPTTLILYRTLLEDLYSELDDRNEALRGFDKINYKHNPLHKEDPEVSIDSGSILYYILRQELVQQNILQIVPQLYIPKKERKYIIDYIDRDFYKEPKQDE